MRTTMILAAALLSACGPSPQSVNDQMNSVRAGLVELNNEIDEPDAAPLSVAGYRAELERVERECLAATAEGRQVPGWDCGFGSLEDAAEWERQYRGRRARGGQ